MQRNDAFPAKAGEESDASVFLVGGKGGEIHRNEIGKAEEGQRDGQPEETMGLPGLKDIRKGGNHICQMRSEDEFSETAIDKPKRRDGIGKDKEKGHEQEKKGLRRKRRKLVEEISNESDRGEGSNGNVEGIVAQGLAFFARFIFLKRFDIETEDFSQQIHA